MSLLTTVLQDRAKKRHAVMIVLVVAGTVLTVTGPDGLRSPSPEEPSHSAGVELPDSDPDPGPTPPAAPSSTGAPTPPTVDPASVAAGPAAEGDVGPLPCVQTSAGGPVWRLTFSDDFDGSAVDTNAWNLYDSPGNAGFGLRRPAAITVDDGLLVLTAQMIDGSLVSGGMAHRQDQTYGRWEFRVRTDPDPSEATSGVVLTWPQSENWPIDGENDIYETQRTAERTPFRTFIHYGADNSQEFLTHEADGTEWHDMAMEWTAEKIAIYRDGRLAGEITNPEAIPHVPHHLTVQLDAWADVMGDPVQMFVDWVRVYRLDADAVSC